MFLNERSQQLINNLRDDKNGRVDTYKASICDAMSIIMFFYQVHASEKEQKMLADAIDTLSNYNELLTQLSKEK